MTQDLIELIESNAILVRQGHFTLAVEKAQEKLKKFQLPDPRYYITQLMQALLSNQCGRIQVLIENLTVRIQFDGPGYSKEELERISDAVFESGKNRQRDRIRELALGLLSVQALNPREVSISSGGMRWERTPGRGRVVESSHNKNEILIQHGRHDTQEPQILRQTCQSCQADIYLNDTVIASQATTRSTGCPWPNYAFRGQGFRGAFGIAYGEITSTHLTLTRYGVVFSKRPEARILPSLIVEMEHEKLRKNASQSDVVEDENYSTMLAQLQKIQLEFAIELSSKRLPGYQAQQVFFYFQELLVQNLSSELLSLPEQHLTPLESQFCQALMLQCSDGRRCSARQVWNAVQEYGTVFYTDDHHRVFSCPPGTCIRLSDAGANSMRSLFPELQKVQRLDSEGFAVRLQRLKQEHSDKLPAAVAVRLVESEQVKMEFRIPDRPPEQAVDLYIRRSASGGERVRLGESGLGFVIVSDRRFSLKPKALQRLVQEYVEPLYRGLAQRLQQRGPQAQSVRRALCHYLEYRYGSLAAAWQEDEWHTPALFMTVHLEPVSLNDLHAWLKVYANVVVSYGSALSSEDHALAITPQALEGLRRILGEERLVLADLSQPMLLERGQQLGLSGAAQAGVEKREVFDEDAELAAIRREMELAENAGLTVVEAKPLDERSVLRQLGIQLQEGAPPEGAPVDLLSDFCLHCLEASKSLSRRWHVNFQGNGLHGLVFAHDGPLPKPLQADRLLVKIADNEPVAYPLQLTGIGGWLDIPAGWKENPEFAFPILRADSEPARADDNWPLPELPFDLGSSHLHLDLIWALRRLFKVAAQHFAGQARETVPSVWLRRISQYLLWDEGWALGTEESWFLRIPIFRNLSSQHLDLHSLRELTGPLRWAGLGAGQVAEPYKTVRLIRPFEVADLERLFRQSLEQAELVIEEKKEQQLLSEIKQFLVQTCQRSHSPLEPAWVEGLRFGEPTRWFGGPRKYFIKHEANEALTRLNPADAIFIRLFREQKGWELKVPVLASAVYTAINRALDDVNDEHELAYLEAMLAQL